MLSAFVMLSMFYGTWFCNTNSINFQRRAEKVEKTKKVKWCRVSFKQTQKYTKDIWLLSTDEIILINVLVFRNLVPGVKQ